MSLLKCTAGLKFTPLLLVAVLGATNAVAAPAVAAPMINGEPVTGTDAIQTAIRNSTAFLKTLSLEKDGSLEPGKCSGVFIGPKVVATAAHCVRTAMAVSIELAGHPERAADADRVILFGNSDFALLSLDSEVPGAMPVPPADDSKVTVDEELILAGWGKRTKDEEFSVTPELRMTRKNVIKVTDRVFIMDPRKGGQVCNGDSGGPVFSQKGGQLKVVGVIAAFIADECGGLDAIQRLNAMLTPKDAVISRPMLGSLVGPQAVQPAPASPGKP